MPTAIDFFCGAGGSSTGLVRAGFEVRAAVNHWAIAIETHNTNHPDTAHFLDDLQQAHPSRYPRVDVAWFSPECTNHSIAGGRKRKNINQLDLWGNTDVDPSEERSRATMREVVQFTEYHRYDVVIVENVVDVRHWQHYDAWWHSIIDLGYEGRVVYANSKFFNVAQSRDRYYAVFWRKGIKAPNLDYRPDGHCQKHGTIESVQAWKRPEMWGRYGKNGQYVWRCPHCASEVTPAHAPASTVIDWSIKGELLSNRTRPLIERTIQRIRAGLRKFAVPVIIPYANGDGPARPVSESLHTITTFNGMGLAMPASENSAHSSSQHGLATPSFISSYYGNATHTDVANALPTLTTVAKHALVQPPPFAPSENDLLEGCSFRMLNPEELKRGMSFPSDYIILGSRQDQVRQIGNAVTPNVAEWIGHRVMESLT